MRCPNCGEEIRFIKYRHSGVKGCVEGIWRENVVGEFQACCGACGEEIGLDDLIYAGFFSQEIHIINVLYYFRVLLDQDREAISKCLTRPIECGDALRTWLGIENPTFLDIINKMFDTSVRIVAELDDHQMITRFLLHSTGYQRRTEEEE